MPKRKKCSCQGFVYLQVFVVAGAFVAGDILLVFGLRSTLTTMQPVTTKTIPTQSKDSKTICFMPLLSAEIKFYQSVFQTA